MAVIAAAYQLWARSGDRPAAAGVPGPLATLVRMVTVVTVAVLAVGTVVTGSGPHAGDAGARRTGLDPQAISQLHADLVFGLLGLSVALWFALRAADAPGSAVRAAGWLVGAELGQGLIGVVQYFTHLPAIAVGLHMVGACLVWVAVLAVVEATRGHAAAPALPPRREPPDHSESLPAALTLAHSHSHDHEESRSS